MLAHWRGGAAGRRATRGLLTPASGRARRLARTPPAADFAARLRRPARPPRRRRPRRSRSERSPSPRPQLLARAYPSGWRERGGRAVAGWRRLGTAAASPRRRPLGALPGGLAAVHRTAGVSGNTPVPWPQGPLNPEPTRIGSGSGPPGRVAWPSSLRNAPWDDGTGSRSPFWAKGAFQEPFFKNRPSGDAAGAWTVDRVPRKKEGRLDG